MRSTIYPALLLLLILQQKNAALALPALPCYEGGYYLDVATQKCVECPAGSYCDQGTNLRVLCPAGQFQSLGQQVSCLDCPENYKCPSAGTSTPTACPNGTVTPSGSSACLTTQCDYENYYYSTTARVCKLRTIFCNYNTQYEAPTPLNRTTERTCRALTVCKTNRLPPQSPIYGGPPGVPLITPLEQYITKYNTRYSDRECKDWAPCAADDYVEQLPVDDGLGFLVQPLVCKKLTQVGGATQYKFVDGSVTRDRDNIWVDCTVCNEAREVQVSACTRTANTVCQPRTRCDPRFEYMKRKGKYDTDDICALRTRCTSDSERAAYEKVPSVDSTDFYQNGTDAQCEYYSECGDGEYQSFPGDDTHDVGCTKCPPGTYRNASDMGSLACRECPDGTYSPVAGASRCLPCKGCSTPNAAQPGELACPFSPSSQHCVRAIRTPCTSTNDTECMMCPTLSRPQGGYDLRFDGVCTACKNGYYYNASEPVVGKRCVPCTPNFYCPSKETFTECFGIQIFKHGAQYVTVPTSAAGSVQPSDCNCSTAGGFEPSPYGSAGVFGCQPCADGFYAPAGQTLRCMPCPKGTYASQRRAYSIDYYKCPSADSPRVSFFSAAAGGGGGGGASSAAAAGGSCTSTVDVGATACQACPTPSKPYTWREGSTSIADCKPCPEGQFLNASSGRCTACRAECNSPHEYETVPCTDTTNRVCASCNLRDEACSLVGEYPTGKCPGPIDAGRACAPCTNKPEGPTSFYVSPPSSDAISAGVRCTWQCADGFVAPLQPQAGSEGCRPCTPMTSANCGPGFIYRACQSLLNTDATCSDQCDAEALGKPGGDSDETSEWVWTTFSRERPGELVQNPDGGRDGQPNIGCMWRCKQGYELRELYEMDDPETGKPIKISFCVVSSFA